MVAEKSESGSFLLEAVATILIISLFALANQDALRTSLKFRHRAKDLQITSLELRKAAISALHGDSFHDLTEKNSTHESPLESEAKCISNVNLSVVTIKTCQATIRLGSAPAHSYEFSIPASNY